MRKSQSGLRVIRRGQSAIDFCRKIVHYEYVDFTQEHKNEIEKKIVEAIVTGLESNKILENQLSEIADFVLERIDALKTHEELVVFLSDLAARWPIFENIALTEKGEAKDKAEDRIASEALKLAQSGKIDDAIDLAKTMTNT